MKEKQTQLSSESEASRQSAEEHLNQFASLFAQAPVAIAVLRGKDLVIELANLEECRIWGRKEESLLGKPLFHAIPEAAGQGLEALLEGVLSSGVPYVGKELPVQLARTPNGDLETIYFDFVYQPMRDPAGRVERILVVANDVTQSVLARRAIEAEREELQRIFMQAPVAIAIREGPAHVFTLANPAYRALIGDREVLGKPLLLALPDLQGQGLDQLLDRVLTTGEPFIGTEVPVRLDRTGTGQLEDRFFDLVFSPKRNGAGVVDGSIASASDVTERVHSRQRVEALAGKLRQSEESLRRVVEASGTGTWEIALPTQEVVANSRFRELFDLAEDEDLTAAKCISRIHPDDVAHATDVVTGAMSGANDGRYVDEYRLCSSGKRTVWIESRGQLRFDVDGTPVRLHGTVLDVTERKAAEAHRQQGADFEQQLIGIVSHDLRNPVTAILLNASVLLRGEELSERQTKNVVRIQTSAERAHRMIRDLLDFTRARLAGGIPIERRQMDFHERVRGVLEEVEATHAGRELRVRLEGDGRGEWDPDRLDQVIQNLVTNALKYSPDGTPVSVETHIEDAGLVMSVHNRGPPIPPERLSKIFDPFQRATVEVDKTGSSMGLGLYIVKQVVGAHGGTVMVESTADAGTTFTVRLPRAPVSR